jgi:hypothetical protein
MIGPRFRRRVVALASFLTLGAAGAVQAKDPPLLTLTAEHFRDTAAVTDDPAVGTTTVSTEPGFREHHGPLRMVWDDEFLQAIIDRRTGQTRFQVYTWIIYRGALRSFRTAKYATPTGARAVETTAVKTLVEGCAVGECTYTELVAFPIDGASLRALAATAASPSLWSYTLAAKSGADYKGALSTAEMAGFLAKVDESEHAHPVVQGAASVVSLQPDLGIDGLAVAAPKDQPTRAGILVSAVKSGSVAQRAGIIIGDIVYEFGGHPISTIADLQSAVSASAPHSDVPLRLYRGTVSMTMSARFN